MTFAALTLLTASAGSGGSISSVTTGVGSSTARYADFQWWGYMSVAGVFMAAFGPDTAIGSVSPNPSSWRGYPIVGIYSGDNGFGGTNAVSYSVVLAGTAATGTVNTLTIDSTPLTANTLSVFTQYQPGYTIFRFTLNTPTTNLFGTSGTHTVTLT